MTNFTSINTLGHTKWNQGRMGRNYEEEVADELVQIIELISFVLDREILDFSDPSEKVEGNQDDMVKASDVSCFTSHFRSLSTRSYLRLDGVCWFARHFAVDGATVTGVSGIGKFILLVVELIVRNLS